MKNTSSVPSAQVQETPSRNFNKNLAAGKAVERLIIGFLNGVHIDSDVPWNWDGFLPNHYRVEIKYCKHMHNLTANFNFENTSGGREGDITRAYLAGVEILILFCPRLRLCYVFDLQKLVLWLDANLDIVKEKEYPPQTDDKGRTWVNTSGLVYRPHIFGSGCLVEVFSLDDAIAPQRVLNAISDVVRLTPQAVAL